jgi:hypothetical protein
MTEDAEKQTVVAKPPKTKIGRKPESGRNLDK